MKKCYENDGLVSVSLPNCSELGVVVLEEKFFLTNWTDLLSGSITPGRELSSLLLLCLMVNMAVNNSNTI